MEVHVKDHCLCERLGKGEFEVTALHGDEVSLKDIATGKSHRIYKALCYVPLSMRFANRDRRVARAQAIGRPRTR